MNSSASLFDMAGRDDFRTFSIDTTITEAFIDAIAIALGKTAHDLHTSHDLFTKEELENWTEDGDTHVHTRMYSVIHDKQSKFMHAYRQLTERILPYVVAELGDTELWIQQSPTLRIDPIGCKAIRLTHTDSDPDHRHPVGELNFVFALTDMFDTNTIWCETEPGKRDFQPLNAKQGTLFRFPGNSHLHTNKKNTTDRSRLSFDFRIITAQRGNQWLEQQQASDVVSFTQGLKFVPGGYYRAVLPPPPDRQLLYKPPISIWQEARQKAVATPTSQDDVLVHVMALLENAEDPWDVVTAFETMLCQLTGARHAVALDTGTSGFELLCDRWRPKNVVMPRKTFVSVPAAFVSRGCHVSFTNSEWSGSYEILGADPNGKHRLFDSCTFLYPGMMSKTSDVHVLSFHHRKIIGIGRGGAILTNDDDLATWLRRASYFGRDRRVSFATDTPTMLGRNAYMPPEAAARGVLLLKAFTTAIAEAGDHEDVWRLCVSGSSGGYPDVSKYKFLK